jgi:hypothetical protein
VSARHYKRGRTRGLLERRGHDDGDGADAMRGRGDAGWTPSVDTYDVVEIYFFMKFILYI